MTKKRIGARKLVFLTCLLWISTSCRAIANYGQERAADFADCFALVIAPGTAKPVYALAAGVEITKWGPIGLGHSEGYAYGFVGRRIGRFRYSLTNPSLIFYAIDGLLGEDIDSVELSAEERQYCTTMLSPQKYAGRNRERGFRFGANVGLSRFFVYADVEIGEVLDFALGIFGLDIMGDDSVIPINDLDEHIRSHEH